MDFWCVMEVDFSAFRSFWLLTSLDLMFCRNFDGIVFFAKVVIETFYVAVNWVCRCTLTLYFSISFWIFWTDIVWKLYLVRCETAFVFCFLREKWIIVYRLLHRHRCRRGKRSGRLHCACMELLSFLRFSLCDVSITGGIYIVFWQIVYRKPRFFLFLNRL